MGAIIILTSLCFNVQLSLITSYLSKIYSLANGRNIIHSFIKEMFFGGKMCNCHNPTQHQLNQTQVEVKHNYQI